MYDEAPKGPVIIVSGIARYENAEKATHIKGKLLYQAVTPSIASLFKMGTSLKGKNLLLE